MYQWEDAQRIDQLSPPRPSGDQVLVLFADTNLTPAGKLQRRFPLEAPTALAENLGQRSKASQQSAAPGVEAVYQGKVVEGTVSLARTRNISLRLPE